MCIRKNDTEPNRYEGDIYTVSIFGIHLNILLHYSFSTFIFDSPDPLSMTIILPGKTTSISLLELP